VGALIDASNITVNGAGPILGVAKKFAVGSMLVKVPVWIVSGSTVPKASCTETQVLSLTLVCCPQLKAEGYEISVLDVFATTV